MKRNDKGKKTRYQQAHPKIGMSFHPRSLFRGLTVPYRNTPGQKYLYPNLRDNDGHQRMTPQEYKNSVRPMRQRFEQG